MGDLNNHKDHKRLLIWLCLFSCSMSTGVIVFFVMTTALKLAIATAVSCLTFVLLFRLSNLSGRCENLIFSTQKMSLLAKRLGFVLLYSLSLITILLVPNLDSQLLAWSAIPFMSYVKVLCALSIAFVFPGYALVKALNRGTFSFLEKITFSCMISLLILVFFGLSTTILLIINICLVGLSFFESFKTAKFERPSKESIVSVLDATILIIAFALFSLILLSIYSGFWLFMGPDIWRHYGWALNLMAGFPEIPLVTRSYHNVLAGFFQLSGFPFINGWILSNFALFVAVLSFYQMSKAYLGRIDRKAPIVSTMIWTFFSGFGWTYALFLRFSSSNSWLEILRTSVGVTNLDIGYSPGLWSIMGENQPVAIGFSSLFTLLYLIRKKDLPRSNYIFLCTVAFSAGYLLHSVEILFIFIPLLLLPLLKFKINLRDSLLSVFLASLVGMSYDLIYQYLYVGTFAATTNFLLLMSISFLSLLTLTTMNLQGCITRRLSQIHLSRRQWFTPKAKIIVISISVLIYFYFLSFLIWLEIEEGYSWASTLPYRFVPWYIYPFLFGTAGILLIIGIAQFRKLFCKYKMTLIFLAAFFAALVLSGRLVSYVNMHYFSVSFFEARMISIIYVPLAMIASTVIILLFERSPSGSSRDHEKASFGNSSAIGLIFLVLLLTGSLSTFMSVDYWTLHSQNHPREIESAEISAFEYLRHNIDSSMLRKNIADFVLVFSPTDVSYQALQAYSGTGTYLPYSYKGRVLFGANRLEQPLSLFSFYDTNFVYIAQRDLESLAKIPNSFVRKYMTSLNKSFTNEGATIYQIPEMTPPASDSEVAVVFPAQANCPMSLNYATLMLANSFLDYTIVLESDPKLQSYPILILPSDPSTPKPEYIDDTFTDGWTKNNEDLTFVEDGESLFLSFRNDENNASVLVSAEKQFPEMIDTSVTRYLTWRVFIKKMVADYENLVDYAGIMLFDENVKDWFWAGAVTLTNPYLTKIGQGTWFEVTFDTQNNNWHKFENVSAIKIVLRVSPSSVQEIRTDFISLHKEPIRQLYSPDLTQKLYEWVEHGGTLLVIASDGLGDFSRMLRIEESGDSFTAQEIGNTTNLISIPAIEVSNLSLADADTQIVASYEGEDDESFLAAHKTIGRGEMTYMVAQPYISALDNSQTDDEKNLLLNKLEYLFQVIGMKLAPKSRFEVQKDEATFSEVNIEGSVTTNSSSLIIPRKTSLAFFANSLGENVSDSQSDNISEMALGDIRTYGNVSWTINSQNLKLSSGGLGPYSKLAIKGEFEVTLQILTGSSVYIELQDIELGNTASYNITAVDTLRLKIVAEQPLELLARTPAISANGTSTIDALYIEKQLYDYEGTDVEITGPIYLSIGYSDTFTTVSDFSIEKDTEMNLAKTDIWDEWGSVPWQKMAVNAVLLLIIVLILVPPLLSINQVEKSSISKRRASISDHENT